MNNFKKHNYYIMWCAQKNNDGTYLSIQAVFTRDYLYADGGDIVTDPFEVKYACKAFGFDYDSLQKECERYFIKKDSIEWNKYLEEPGEPTEPDEIDRIKKEREILSKLRERGIDAKPLRLFGHPMWLVKSDREKKILREVLESEGLRCAN